ncbi:MAG TPA: M48 family metallopeptidase [Gammaproteobacteria bacterium]
MNTFTLLFLCMLGLSLGVEVWLALRQLRHVRAHRERVPAPFADRVTPEEHRKAADYTVARTRFGLVGLAAGALLLLGWTLGGGIALLQAQWQGLLGPGLAAGVALLLSVLLLGVLLELPLAAWRTFRLEARFGFNRNTPRQFALDTLKGLGLALALGVPLAWAALWLMQRAGPGWWLWLWALWFGFNLLLAWAWPRLIAPLFNRFTPLTEAALKARVDALLARTGFDSRGVFVMDGSRRSAHGNAYFTGFGRAKRIVLFDTLVATLAPAEVEAVLAHELGHFRLHHVAKRLAASALLSLGGLALLGWLAGQAWFYHGLGVAQPSDAAALLLFALALPPFTTLLHPLGAWLARRHEYQADAFAAQHSDRAALAAALVKLYRDNASTLTPDPLHSAFHDSHPPAPLRLARLAAA